MHKNPLYVYGDWDKLRVPAHMHYGRHLLSTYGGYKKKAAIINAETGEIFTFEQLVQMAADVAVSLVKYGVRKGEVVGVCSEKRFEFLPTVLGILCAGAVFAPVDYTGGRAILLHRLNLSKPSLIICSAPAYERHKDTFNLAKRVPNVIVYDDESNDPNVMKFSQFRTEKAVIEDFIPVDVNADDFAFILYSSGTTGLPKGIPTTHLKLFYILGDDSVKSEFSGTSTLITREWYQPYGLIHTLCLLYEGSTVFYCPSSQEKGYLEAIQNYKIQTILLAPGTLTDLVKSPLTAQYDVSSILCFVSCSAHLSGQLEAAIKTRFPNLRAVIQLYGMTEMGTICSDWISQKGRKPGSVGRPLDGYTIKVVDLNTRKPLGPNQRGEICLKSSSLMHDYIGDTNRDYKDEEGFFKTGDIGYYDDDRYFYIVGRIKELIKYKSYSVAPAELETVLNRHPCVLKSGVVGAPHSEYGEVPTAFVVLKPGSDVTAEELVKYLNGQVSITMKLAGGVRFVIDLPTVSGKLDRNELKRILTQNA